MTPEHVNQAVPALGGEVALKLIADELPPVAFRVRTREEQPLHTVEDAEDRMATSMDP